MTFEEWFDSTIAGHETSVQVRTRRVEAKRGWDAALEEAAKTVAAHGCRFTSPTGAGCLHAECRVIQKATEKVRALKSRPEAPTP